MRLRTAILLMLFIGIVLDHGAPMLADHTWALRRSRKTVEELLRGRDRVVDFGVVLKVVNKDPNGEELLPGRPRLRVLREHRFGFLFDTLLKRPIGPSRDPVEWTCSEDQEPLVMHAESLPAAVWMQGSFGSGKTSTGGMWSGRQIIKHAMHPLQGAGVTAPTDDRLEPVRAMLFGPKRDGKRLGGLWPSSWYSWSEGSGTCVTATDLQIDFRSCGLSTAALGSPLQGYNWAWCWNDELQDYYELDADIRARLRSAWNDRPERFVTVTPKDDPGYRTFRGKVETSRFWHRATVSILRSPFVGERYLEEQKSELSPRAYQRNVLGLDVGPERAVYPTFDRTRHLRMVPIRAKDVTAEVLRPWGANQTVLVGHDPGTLQDVSLVLKAYRIPGENGYAWFVVDEITTPQSTTQSHVVELKKRLRAKFGCYQIDYGSRPDPASPVAHVRVDPQGDSDSRTDKSVYDTFRQYGLYARSAAYKRGTAKGRVPKKPAIEMVCRLFEDAHGVTRLYIECDDRRQPVAPKLVEALERSEYDLAGEPETQDKDKDDVSHWPAALRYALWPFERRVNVTLGELMSEEESA